ncbi:MAG: phage tail sheath C-terminal domain-containing protein [Lachnospiraceae bacterium]|nr:phage tail sheath C-terminal domain-containing protein [Lachnospiraceae bacterium]
MSYGGGTWTSQNKVLPGAYINVVSAEKVDASLSDRGIVAIPMELKWGAEIIEIEAEDFQPDSVSVFGYLFDADELINVREALKKAQKLIVYRLNYDGVKASNDYATAKYAGTRGNDVKIVITANVDDASKFDVVTYAGVQKIDTQTVAMAAELKENDFVTFKSDKDLAETAGIPLTGGTDATLTGAEHNTALEKLEAYSFNTLVCTSNDDKIKALYKAHTKRMRNDVGAKFQTVFYNYDADDIGCINVTSKPVSGDEQSLVYWVGGAEAGCAVNKSVQSTVYDGEYVIDTSLKQSKLKEALKKGQFVFHKDGEKVEVLDDINSFVSFTSEMNEDFHFNQVVRVVDQVAIDTALVFKNKYLGKMPNNASGRVSFWNDLVAKHMTLQHLEAIQNFDSKDITVEKGDAKNAVVVTDEVDIVCAMAKLYMNIYVK